MSWIKNLIALVVVVQVTVLLLKDDVLINQIKKAAGMEKLSVFFDAWLALNQDWFAQIKEYLSTGLEQTQTTLHDEWEDVDGSLDSLKSLAKKKTKSATVKGKKAFAKVEQKVKVLLDKLDEEYEYAQNKHHVQEKLEKALDDLKQLHKIFKK